MRASRLHAMKLSYSSSHAFPRSGISSIAYLAKPPSRQSHPRPVPHQRMGSPTSVRFPFSNRCRAFGVRSIHPPIQNRRFRGPPLIRSRRRNRRPRMLTLMIPPSPLAMTSTRLSRTKVMVGSWFMLDMDPDFWDLRYTISAILLFCTGAYHAVSIPKMVRYLSSTLARAPNFFFEYTRHMMRGVP